MDLFEIKAEIPPGSVDATDDLLLDLGIGGWSLLEDAIAKRAWVVGIFKSDAEARAQWAALRPRLPAAPLGRAVCRALGDRDWRDSYKAHFKAWKFGRLHWVPVWERKTHKLPKGHAAIWLDPGLAFGTGNHETTRLCVERLVALPVAPGARVTDAGCGSGILAISAAKLGHTDIFAFDNDPEAVRVSRENAALNKADGAIRFFIADLAAGLARRKSEIVLANIQTDVLLRHVKDLLRAVAPGGVLILSGILAVENAQLKKTFLRIAGEAAPARKWKMESRVLGEWSDIQMSAM
jgi:ribosomal protein L11 methyltransferase